MPTATDVAACDLVRDLTSFGHSDLWRATESRVASAARSDSTVLFTGESGTGKELLARRLHALSGRSSGPLVKVNCAAVPVATWESEFFGHRAGSLPGATTDREGRFGLADGGTLLLDEVAGMPLAGQAKLLRVIQDGEFERLGDDEPVKVNVRVIATTNAALDVEVKEGRFRADLYYLLDVLRIDVPPLRERPEDIPLLARHFARSAACRLGRSTPELSSSTLAVLLAHTWPGNVRELQNAVERAMVFAPDRGPIDEAVPSFDRGQRVERATEPGEGAGLNLRQALRQRERELLLEAERRAGGVHKDAARILGIDPRNLSYYRRKHDLHSRPSRAPGAREVGSPEGEGRDSTEIASA